MFGARYFGPRYFGPRYFGTTKPVTEALGTLAATEAADVAAFVGKAATEGVLDGAEGSDVAAAFGNVDWRVTLAATEAADVADADGFVETSANTGWKFPTANTIVSGGGWINPGNIYAKDGAITEAHHNAIGVDWFLKTEGFGIGPAVIPDDAVILKVELGVTWNVSPP
jgi:hypothetical protein